MKPANEKSKNPENDIVSRYQGIVRILVITNVIFAAFFVFSLFDAKLVKDVMSYENFISIILTALGVILAALALGLGALAIVGWQAFEANVERSVGEVIGEVLRKGFQKDGPLRPSLEEAVDKVSYDIISDAEQDKGLNEDDQPEVDTSGTNV